MTQTEIDKLIAEQHKLLAETLKFSAEEIKLHKTDDAQNAIPAGGEPPREMLSESYADYLRREQGYRR